MYDKSTYDMLPTLGNDLAFSFSTNLLPSSKKLIKRVAAGSIASESGPQAGPRFQHSAKNNLICSPGMKEASTDRRQTLEFWLWLATAATSQQAKTHYTEDFRNSPWLKVAMRGHSKQRKRVLEAGRGLLFGATAVALEVSKAISRLTCPRERTRLNLFPSPKARSGALNPEQLELPGGDWGSRAGRGIRVLT